MPIIEISHRSHLQHNLRLETRDEPFHCNGCKEPGFGSRYTCETCRFNLHESCAVAAPGATLEHDLFSNRTFNFHHEHPKRPGRRICDACGKHVQGFVYYCPRGDLDLHPCCASLRTRFTENGRTFSLRVNASNRCSICGHPGGSLFYSSGCNTVHLHLSCMKEVALQTLNVNGRHQSNRAVTTGNSSGRIIYSIVGIAIQHMLGGTNIGDPSIAMIIAAVVGALFSG